MLQKPPRRTTRHQARYPAAPRRAGVKVVRSIPGLKQIPKNKSVGLATLDRKLRLLHVNPAFARISGKSQAFHLGRPVQKVLPFMTPALPAILQRALRTRQQIINSKVSGRRRGNIKGSDDWLVSCIPIVEESGEPRRLHLVVQEGQSQKAPTRRLINENQFQTMADSAPVMIWQSSVDKRCTYFNEEWLRFTGRPMKEQLGDGWIESVHPEDRRHCMEIYVRAFDARTPFVMTYRLRRFDQEYRWILDNGVPWNDMNGRFAGYLGSCTDISDYREVQEQLLQVIESMPIALVLAGVHGEIDLVNAQTEQLFGYTRSELVGNMVEILIPERFRTGHPGFRDNFFVHPAPRHMGAARDLYGMHKNGREIPVEIALTPIKTKDGPQVLVSILDLTERKRAQEALQRSEEFNRVVLMSLRSHIAILDSEGKIISANEAWKNSAGDKKHSSLIGALVGTSYIDVCRRDAQAGDQTAQAILDGIAAVRSRSRDAFSMEYLRGLTTEPQWFLIEIVPLRGAGGGAVISHTNITEQKRAQLEAQDQRAELSHMRRVSTISELAASISHELNQPLTAILSNAQAAQRYMSAASPDLGEVRAILSDIVAADKRAGEVIRSLRALFKKRELELHPLQPNDVVTEVAVLLHSDAILRQSSVRLEMTPDLPPIFGDDVQLQQVLLILIFNAFDAMTKISPKNRIVTVKTSQDDQDLVRVSVKDNGHGIEKATMDHIFDPFFTTKKEGMGMGLAVAAAIVSRHKGRLWAENNDKTGAVFHFTLPVCRTDRPADQPS